MEPSADNRTTHRCACCNVDRKDSELTCLSCGEASWIAMEWTTVDKGAAVSYSASGSGTTVRRPPVAPPKPKQGK